MKNVVFVVGHDFEHPELPIGRNLDFSKMCIGRLNYLIDYNKIAKPFRVTIFNFPRGRVDKYQIESNSSKKLIRNEYIDSELKFTAISKSMYGEWVSHCSSLSENLTFEKHAFKRNNPEVLSISNVYDYITKIGEAEKESIIELSFFSHSYLQGPILVNSYDSNCHLPDRDDDDKDCRAKKDFNDTNLEKEQKKIFRDGFDSNGAIWIYGCNMMNTFVQLFKRIFHDKNFNNLDSETQLRLTKVRASVASWIQSYSLISIAEKNTLIENSYVVKEKSGVVNYVDINVKFKYIKQMLSKSLKVTYAGQIARITNVNTFAGLLGTESELFEKVKYPHMAIRKQGYRQILSFYEKYLEIEFDKEGTYYANYLKIK